jgi:hypothetical protein
MQIRPLMDAERFRAGDPRYAPAILRRFAHQLSRVAQRPARLNRLQSVIR